MVAINIAVCLAGLFVCSCRLSQMSSNPVKPSIKFSYVLWFAVFAASAFSWTASDYPPTIEQVAILFVILANLLIGVRVWIHEVPNYARKHGGD